MNLSPMFAIVSDPLFYLAAIPAVLVTGVAKGGFGAGLGILAVPLMALTVSPLQAAAVMLPILCLMDLFSLWAYRGRFDGRSLRLLLPAALAGIGIGWLTAGLVDDRMIRLIVGAVAVVFAVDHWLGRRAAAEPKAPNAAKGGFWAAVSGFTSFIAHAGGPPLSVYLLPLKLDKTVFVGTTVVFFAVVNYVKLVPYTWLGQFSAANLATSLVLAPLAPLGIWLGLWLHRRTSPDWFYRLSYLMIFVVGLKLAWDGAGF